MHATGFILEKCILENISPVMTKKNSTLLEFSAGNIFDNVLALQGEKMDYVGVTSVPSETLIQKI